ncbi:MAG TPA: hypothetical protein VM124_03710 [Candidatus Limnocylindrales bacterium]|nr:hypothetical protein [Candidatus Limnocylindrales bacterium]
MKKRIILAILACVSFIFLFWLYTHAYIKIIPSSGDNISYLLTNLSDNKTQSFDSTSSIKKLVKRGEYQLLAQKGETSYFSVIKANGFLRSSVVSPRLVKEKARKFVGDNPASCMYYTGQILVSGACEDLYSQLNLHVPATSQQATYIQRLSSQYDGVVEGVVSTQQGIIALLRSVSGEDHVSYKVSPEFGISDPIAMTELDKNKTYSLQAYKDGFLIYDKSLGHILYYSSLRSRPSVISNQRPKDSKLGAYGIQTQGSSLVVAYSDHPEDQALASSDEEHTQTKPPKRTKVSLMVQDGGATREYTFTKRLSSFDLCGTKKLCVLDTSGTLEVYDISGSKLRLLFAIAKVEHIGTFNNSLIVALGGGLLNLDVDKRAGYILYSYGNYRFCGMRTENIGPVLCMINGDDKAVALFVDPTTDNTDSIDKKISQLLNLSEAKMVSAYGNYIFISPNLGEAEYQPSLRVFGYDPKLIETTNSTIAEEIDRVGIDRSKYTIFNPFNSK